MQCGEEMHMVQSHGTSMKVGYFPLNQLSPMWPFLNKQDKHTGTGQDTAPTRVSFIPLTWIGISCEILGVAALGTQTSGQGDVHPRYAEMGLDARVPKRAEKCRVRRSTTPALLMKLAPLCAPRDAE